MREYVELDHKGLTPANGLSFGKARGRAVLSFLFKCLLALLPAIALILYTAFFPLCYMDEEYPSWKYTADKQKGRIMGEKAESGGEVLILGDSRAMADLSPVYMGENFYNLAAGGATPIEMYYTLKDCLKSGGTPECVIIMFAPFHYSYIDNFWTRSVYFHHLSFLEAVKVLADGRKYSSQALNDGEHDLFDLVSLYLDLPGSYMPALINARFAGRYTINRKKYDDLIKERGHGLFGIEDGSSDLNYESNYESLDKEGDFRLLDNYMGKLLVLCRENGIRTILVQPPMNEASYYRLHADYISQYTDYIESMSELYPEAEIDPLIPCYKNELFGDSSHLNEAGSKEYTKEFMEKYW